MLAALSTCLEPARNPALGRGQPHPTPLPAALEGHVYLGDTRRTAPIDSVDDSGAWFFIGPSPA